jgi:HK97 family phage portal protein
MSFLRGATKTLERRGAPGNIPWGDTTPPSNGMLGYPAAGVNVDEKAVIGLTTVFACVSVISDAIATLPLDQYRGTRKNKTLIPSSPIVVDPFCEITQQDWVTQVMVSMLLRGNSYGKVIERDRMGFPVQIMPIHPDRVSVRRNSDTGLLEYRFCGDLVNLEDVFHIKSMCAPGGMIALNPIENARLTFGVLKAAQMYAAAWFANSAQPAGVITVPGSLSPDATIGMVRDWMQAHQGINKSGLPAVLTEGAQFAAIGVGAEDAQFLATQQLMVTDVMALYRVPPHVLGYQDKSTSWGAGIEQQELGLFRNTLNAWCHRIESAYNRILPDGEFVRFDPSERLRGDTLTRAQANTLARNGGWLNVDEIRDQDDLEPLPDGAGQVYGQPLASNTTSDVPNPMEQPPPPPPPPQGGNNNDGP